MVPTIARLKNKVYGTNSNGTIAEFEPGEYFVTKVYSSTGSAILSNVQGATVYVVDFEIEILSP